MNTRQIVNLLYIFDRHILSYFFFKVSSSSLDSNCKFHTKLIRRNEDKERVSVLQKDDICTTAIPQLKFLSCIHFSYKQSGFQLKEFKESVGFFSEIWYKNSF